MSSNTSGIDRIIRLVIAAVALFGAFAVGASSVLGIILLVVAVAMVVTAAIGWCPIYRILGLSTKKASA
jgi:hypothetical protein